MDFIDIDNSKPFIELLADIEAWKEEKRKRGLADLNAGVITVDELFRRSCAIRPESARTAKIRFGWL